MNKTISRKLLCGAISAALLFFACGDESGMDAKNSSVASEVDTRFELGKCTEDQNGTTILVTTENAYYGCLNGMWTKQGDGTINPANQDTPIQAISSSYLLLQSSSSINTIESPSSENIPSSIRSSSSVRNMYSSSSSSKMKAAWSYLNPNISYGEFTDSRDGQIYKTVRIGNQVWMAENLNYNIDSLKSMCYNNSADSCFKYGRLYNWSVAKDACPKGWHLPTIDEWRTLISFAGDPEVAKLKLKSKSGWLVLAGIESVTGNGTDDFGFTVLPAGNYSGYENNFREVGVVTMFWSAGEYECNDEKICSYSLRIGGGTKVYENFNKIPNETVSSEIWLNSIRCIEGPAPITTISSSSVHSSSSFDLKMNNLNPNIDYGEFIDSRDGQYYKTVQIGNQVWMAENMNYDYGDNACYNDSLIYCAKDKKRHGRFYPYSTAKTICPNGWHLPDTSEWNTLFRYVKSPGPLLRSKKGWNDTTGVYNYSDYFKNCNYFVNESYLSMKAFSDTLNASEPDAFGFSWQPAGRYDVIGHGGAIYGGSYPAFTQGEFKGVGNSGCFWSKSTEYEIVCIKEETCLNYGQGGEKNVGIYSLTRDKTSRYEAYTVRCLKD